MIIPIPGTFTIPRRWSYLDNHPSMVTIPRIVTIPRLLTNSIDQTGALQLLFGYRTSLKRAKLIDFYISQGSNY